MKNFTYICAVIVSVLSGFGAQVVFAGQIPLEQFVREMGNKYDVWFTLEGAYPGQTYSSMVLAESVVVQSAPADIESVIFDLTNSIRYLTVVVDAGNRAIYHIIDRRLLELSDYCMSGILDSVKFEGKAADFVDRIKAKVPTLSNQKFSLGPVIVVNSATRISIDDKSVTVRDALSNGVSLTGYGRLIWTSFTSLETRESQIQFTGAAYVPH